jgi:hypothetical protein
VSQPTLPPDRPRWAVLTIRTIQTVLAVLALAVLAWTAAASPTPDPAPPSSWRVVIAPDTTLRPAGYTPQPAGPPCPEVDQPPEADR